MNQPRVMIMAGGTGGHIFPALALAKVLLERGWNVHWLGSKNGMEEKLVSNQSISLHLVSVKGLRGNGLVGWLKAPWMLIKAVAEARNVLKKNTIQLSIGFGGFASGPGGIASVLNRTPLFLHEQNAVAGMTNRRLAKFAQIVFEGFPDTFEQSSAKSIRCVGNPVRAEITAINKSAPEHLQPRVLVIGGSRGAQALNEFLPDMFNSLLEKKLIAVWHQTGSGKLEATKQRYVSDNELTESQYSVASVDLRVTEFIDDMKVAYEWADLVICRAGASTVAEIAAVGLAAVFVPYPFAVDDHQTANALWLVDNGGAEMLKQSDLESGKTTIVNQWLSKTTSELFALGQKNKSKAFNQACEEMAEACEIYRSIAA